MSQIKAIARAAKASYREVTWRFGLDTEVFVKTFHYPYLSIVAIRGTEKNLYDIKTDLDFSWADMGFQSCEAMAHHGFREVAKLVAKKIHEEYYGGSLDGSKVILTGHSLGGAVATLVAAMLADQDLFVQQVVTFGSPRPGDARLRNYMNSTGIKMTRYVNAFDPVTAIPFCGWGFRHVGDLVYLNDVGSYKNPPWWKRAWLRLRIEKSPLKAHSMDLYLERILNEA